MTSPDAALLAAELNALRDVLTELLRRLDAQEKAQRQLFMAWRQADLMRVDATERCFCLEPRTAELRKAEKEARRQGEGQPERS